MLLVTPDGGVTSVTAVAPDGSHAYYVQNDKLMVWDGAAATVVAPTPSATFTLTGPYPRARISDDGNLLLFAWAGHITDDDTVEPTDELYR